MQCQSVFLHQSIGISQLPLAPFDAVYPVSFGIHVVQFDEVVCYGQTWVLAANNLNKNQYQTKQNKTKKTKKKKIYLLYIFPFYLYTSHKELPMGSPI